MRTVPKREKIHYDVELFEENSPNPDALADCDFGLLMLPKKLIQTEVRICSHSIVVVDASVLWSCKIFELQKKDNGKMIEINKEYLSFSITAFRKYPQYGKKRRF